MEHGRAYRAGLVSIAFVRLKVMHNRVCLQINLRLEGSEIPTIGVQSQQLHQYFCRDDIILTPLEATDADLICVWGYTLG